MVLPNQQAGDAVKSLDGAGRLVSFQISQFTTQNSGTQPSQPIGAAGMNDPEGFYLNAHSGDQDNIIMVTAAGDPDGTVSALRLSTGWNPVRVKMVLPLSTSGNTITKSLYWGK